MAKMKHHKKESDGLEENFNHFRGGVVFKQSKDAEGLTKTSVQEYKDVARNSKNPVNLNQESKATVKCSMDVEEPIWNFIQENNSDMKNCIDYNACLTAKFSHHIKEEPEICSVDYMEKNKKGCVACKYHKRKCLPECPFAPIFPADKEKDFQNVRRVFGASNFIKLMKSVAKSQQHLAAKTMIIEANARVSDPVNGLGVFAVILSKQLDYLSSELDLVNQQIQYHRQRR
ncbi:hypothetical protein MKW92_035706 [Papaver armeniacum]|nr:hypothetical protein MKW92_035706 [Papaver armeniacum]